MMWAKGPRAAAMEGKCGNLILELLGLAVLGASQPLLPGSAAACESSGSGLLQGKDRFGVRLPPLGSGHAMGSGAGAPHQMCAGNPTGTLMSYSPRRVFADLEAPPIRVVVFIHAQVSVRIVGRIEVGDEAVRDPQAPQG